MADKVFRRIGIPVSGSSALWFSTSLAGRILRDEFFGGPSTAGYISVWDGAAWVKKPVKYWNGSTWTIKPIKYWNGSVFVSTN